VRVRVHVCVRVCACVYASVCEPMVLGEYAYDFGVRTLRFTSKGVCFVGF